MKSARAVAWVSETGRNVVMGFGMAMVHHANDLRTLVLGGGRLMEEW